MARYPFGARLGETPQICILNRLYTSLDLLEISSINWNAKNTRNFVATWKKLRCGTHLITELHK